MRLSFVCLCLFYFSFNYNYGRHVYQSGVLFAAPQASQGFKKLLLGFKLHIHISLFLLFY